MLASKFGKAFSEILRGIEPRLQCDKTVADVGGAPAEADRVFLPQLRDTKRDDMPYDFGGIEHTHLGCMRLIIVARDQAPKLTFNHHRDSHGGGDTHVAQIFTMNGRGGSEHGG